MKTIIRLAILTILVLPYSVFAQGQALSGQQLNKYYQKLLDTYDVPGLAVAIVKKDSIILQNGYGYLNIDNQHKVDKTTLFGIASLSKTFTAGLVAKAVAEEKLKFDTCIKSILPGFKLYDPYVTKKITIQDALSHRTGLGNFSGDLIWYGSSVADTTIINRLQHLEPEHGFRTDFGYSNIMYLITGKILEQVYHNTYAEILDSIMLTPLNMRFTTPDYNAAMMHRNLAQPHINYKDKTIKQPYLSWDNMQPAGGVFSNVEEMSRYIQMLLNSGTYKNEVLINSKYLKKLWQQQTPLNLSWLDKQLQTPVNFKSYGMGWSLMDYNGHKALYHSGGLDGMVSQMVIVPDKGTGAIFLANKTTALPTVLMYDFLDRLLGNDSLHHYPTRTHALLEKIKEPEVNKAVTYTSTQNFDTGFYCGKYYDSLVGPATISYENDSLFLKFKESRIFKGYLVKTDMLSFDLYWPNVPSLHKGNIDFEVNGLGEIKGFTINLPNPDLHFDELHFSKQN